MSTDIRQGSVARRTFLARLTAAVAAFGAMSGSAAAEQAAAQTAPPVPAQPPAAPTTGGWQPARHPEDDWYDETTAKHRFFMDTTSSAALGSAMAFARNGFEANAAGYKLTDADLAQIICLRHRSTSFAFNDAMWAKYGAPLAEGADVPVDAAKPPVVNPHDSEGRVTLSALAKRGVRYAVCAMATQRLAGSIATKTNAKTDDVLKELTEHLVPNAHMVAAGIVAVNRAQERGYTSSSVVGGSTSA